MQNVSRRRFVAAATAGTTASVAGCLDALDGGGDGEGDLPGYSDWLAADLLADIEDGGFFHVDLQLVQAEWPEQALQEFDVERIAADLGVDVDDLDGMLALERGGDSADRMDVVLTGSFERDALVEDVSMGLETESYGDYEVILEMMAIGTDAIVVGEDYDRLIDARNGDADRITAVDDEWEAALRNVSGAAFTGVMLDPDEAFVLMGVAMDANGGNLSLRAYAHFQDEETAESELEAVQEETESEFVDGEGEVTDVRVEGNVVVVEAEISDFDW